MSTQGSTRAIIAALLANLGIAIAKFIAFLFSGSSSMLGESVPSLAHTGTQLLLLRGGSVSSAHDSTPFLRNAEAFASVRFVTRMPFTDTEGCVSPERMAPPMEPAPRMAIVGSVVMWPILGLGA